jgi:hypothetical protein
MSTADSGFLGTGWAFDPSAGIGVDDGGRIAAASDEEKVRQSIILILSTAPGERIGRPTFGCGIHDLVFATRTSGTMGDIARAVTEAIGQWEPRVDLLAVEATPHPDDPAGVLVQIQVEVRATNSRFNLVYPFYLSA